MRSADGLSAAMYARVCAVVDLESPPLRGGPYRPAVLATAVRTRWDEICFPGHVLDQRPHGRLYLLLDLAGIESPAPPPAGWLQGPIAELRRSDEHEGHCVRVSLRGAPLEPRIKPEPPIPLEVGMRTLIAGFPAGRTLCVAEGRILPLPSGRATPAFHGLRRGSQRIPSGMSGSPVFAADGAVWRLAGMVVGASESSLPGERIGVPRLEGARILSFFDLAGGKPVFDPSEE